MFDIFRLKEVLVQYKKVFVSEQWPNEKYKWEAVKCFQDNWDINAKDFADMLTRSLSKTCNLLASMNNFPAKMIQGFAKVAPEEVRAMFIALFDESNDVVSRVLDFKNQSSILLEKYGNGAGQHYQYENAISTYLWLRYPDKYYIFKLSEVKAVASELEADYRFKKGAYADNIRNFLKLYDEISEYLKSDTELVNIFQSQVEHLCQSGPYCFNDLDMLTVGMYNQGNVAVGKPCTENEYRMQFTLWCLAGTPLFIGADLRSICPKLKDMLQNKALLEIDQDEESRPPYLVSKRSVHVPVSDEERKTAIEPLKRIGGQLLTFLKILSDFEFVIAYYNLHTDEHEILCSFADAGIPLASGYGLSMTDVFTGENIGVVNDYHKVSVPGHDCRLYRCKMVKINA